MRALRIMMPMAGEGSRFTREGWTTPKPLIEVEGRRLFERALAGFVMPPQVEVRHSFIVRQEHIERHTIDRLLLEACPDASIHAVAQTTRGAVETCMVAAADISDDEGVAVVDCDLQFSSRDYTRAIADSLAATDDAGGVLLSFPSSDPRYSYAATGADGVTVTRTAEKQPISTNALCGAYYFGSGRLFKAVAEELLAEAEIGAAEYYISLLYNKILARGGQVRLTRLDEYASYGTPAELRQNLHG